MTAGQQYVLNLANWELPELRNVEYALVEELVARALWTGISSEALTDTFHDLLDSRLLEILESAVDETIKYWLRGLGDGNNGCWPELCVEMPYLEYRESADPLTLCYCVCNGDNTRTELNRTTLDAVISQCLAGSRLRAGTPARTRAIAAKLREIAQKLEKQE